MNRRTFLRIAGIAAASMAAAASGVRWSANFMDDLPSVDPFAPEPWLAAPDPAPVLVLINEDPLHPFGRFLTEILWAEGLNAFSAARLADFDARRLAEFACVLVSAGKCTPNQSQMLADYAANGGGLVVFKPEGALAEALGLAAAGETGVEGWLQVEPRHELAHGMTAQPLSLHVPAGLYPVDETETAAWLGQPSGHPAAFVQRHGAGWVAAWAYDLARNVVLTRQGNPAKAKGADGQPLQRPADLFEGWLDFERMRYPQADEQQRLLANMVTWLCRARLPLPRLWYFTGKTRSLLIATSDSHRNTFAALERITRIVEQHQGSMTINYSPPLPSDLGLMKIKAHNTGADLGILPQPYFPTPEQFDELRARGHEITVHTYITDTYMQSIERYWKAFNRMNYGSPGQTTRTHDLDWRGWSDAARLQAGLGIRMNTDYYNFGPLFRRGPGQWEFIHFTGSGLAMRFANSDGRILNIYQQVTQFGDEHFFEVPWIGSDHMGPERGAQITSDFFQSSLDGQFAAVTINFHADPFDMEDRFRLPAQSFLSGTLAAAQSLGVPIWTAQRWLDFISIRQAARFENLSFDENTMVFDLAAEQTSQDSLSILLPLEHRQTRLAEIRVDGQSTPFAPWSVGGLNYGLISLVPGPHHIQVIYS